MNIKFAKTRYSYDSYTDFWKLVDLSGYPTCYIDEIDFNSDIMYVTAPMNGELKGMTIPKDKKCKIAHWNLERPGGSGGLDRYINDNKELVYNGVVDLVIVSDKQLARDTGFHYVPIGGHEGLGEISEEKIYDVVHLMCYSPRRGEWFSYPKEKRYVDGIIVAPSGWGEERRHSLMASWIMMSIHQDSHFYCEPLRFVLAACYGLPIVSERVTDWFPYYGDLHFEFDLGNEISTIKYLLKDKVELQYRGKYIRYWMTNEFGFRKCIEKYL